jgi:hypothetical protein
MKKIGIITLLVTIMFQAFSQEASAEEKVKDLNPAAAPGDITKVVVGQDLIIIEDGKEDLKVRVGNRGLTILESLEGDRPKFEFKKFDKNEEDFIWQDDGDSGEEKSHRRSHFKGHWAGIEFGLNNYMVADYSMTLPASIDYMTLHSSKSMNFSLNFSQISLGLTRRIGIVTGLGLDWNNYRFDGDNNIQKGNDGVIGIYDPGELLKKSKLQTLYLNLPLLLEIQIPADHSHLNIAAGPIGAVKLCSKSKIIFENGDKVESDDDFSLNLLRYGATARIGYENIQIYATYYPTPLFKTGKTPGGVNLYPFEIGFAFTID